MIQLAWPRSSGAVLFLENPARKDFSLAETLARFTSFPDQIRSIIILPDQSLPPLLPALSPLCRLQPARGRGTDLDAKAAARGARRPIRNVSLMTTDLRQVLRVGILQ